MWHLGPHKTPTHFENIFFLTIVDDYTRCTWLFLMNHKYKTQHILESFITFAQNQFQISIKTIRVDNRLKFISMRIFFLKKGIECQRTCVYTPQQNGEIERKHRHILNIARTLLFQFHLPLEFWRKCVLTVTCIINRLPSPLLKNKSPFELYNRSPSLSHLKTFSPKNFWLPQLCMFHLSKNLIRALDNASLLVILSIKNDTNYLI